MHHCLLSLQRCEVSSYYAPSGDEKTETHGALGPVSSLTIPNSKAQDLCVPDAF